jgi:NAD(P)-dependent dehydrogenase (short-subunit alcohol dehydrogenase family)
MLLACLALLFSFFILKALSQWYRFSRLQQARGDGKVVVITGAGSGIGFATAALMARQGWIVHAVDISVEGLERLATKMEREVPTTPITTHVLDITNCAACDKLLSTLTTGARPLSSLQALVNCAGY